MGIPRLVKREILEDTINYAVYLLDGGLSEELIFDGLMENLQGLQDLKGNYLSDYQIGRFADMCILIANKRLGYCY